MPDELVFFCLACFLCASTSCASSISLALALLILPVLGLLSATSFLRLNKTIFRFNPALFMPECRIVSISNSHFTYVLIEMVRRPFLNKKKNSSWFPDREQFLLSHQDLLFFYPSGRVSSSVVLLPPFASFSISAILIATFSIAIFCFRYRSASETASFLATSRTFLPCKNFSSRML